MRRGGGVRAVWRRGFGLGRAVHPTFHVGPGVCTHLVDLHRRGV